MISFNYRGFTLSEAIDAMMAYDLGCTDSGIKDDMMKKVVRDFFTGLSSDEMRLVLSRHVREQYLTEDKLDAGYGIESVEEFLKWFSEEIS